MEAELYRQPPQGKSGPIWVFFVVVKNTLRICAGATTIFWGPYHNLLAPKSPILQSVENRQVLWLKDYGMVPEKNGWPRHMYKWYFFLQMAQIGQFFPQHW